MHAQVRPRSAPRLIRRGLASNAWATDRQPGREYRIAPFHLPLPSATGARGDDTSLLLFGVPGAGQLPASAPDACLDLYQRGTAPVLDPIFDPLWQRLLDVIEKEAGVERRRLVPSDSFIEDLDLD